VSHKHLAFVVAFDSSALIAMIAASLSVRYMPETRAGNPRPKPARSGFMQVVSKKKVAVE
jgi:hypothetical protein